MICDFAETYQIYDYKQLPLQMVAVFAAGLRENSRVMLKLNNQRVSLDTLLQATTVDQLALLLWTKTKDGQKGINQPKLLTEAFGLKNTRQELVFNSGEAFQNARQEMLLKITGGEHGN